MDYLTSIKLVADYIYRGNKAGVYKLKEAGILRKAIAKLRDMDENVDMPIETAKSVLSQGIDVAQSRGVLTLDEAALLDVAIDTVQKHKIEEKAKLV